jgi:hypothetical protein
LCRRGRVALLGMNEPKNTATLIEESRRVVFAAIASFAGQPLQPEDLLALAQAHATVVNAHQTPQS